MGRTSRDKRDIYYRKAKEEGWRARSAFKLLQIDEQFSLFTGVRRVVDLCAAPGSWSQVLSRKLHAGPSAAERDQVRIVSVDLQEMAPIEGVHCIAGDITSQATVNEVLGVFREDDDARLADLVVCDGAPDVTGMHDLDEYIQGQLLLSALAITTQLLREGGTFVAKIFRGRSSPLIYTHLKAFFPDVYVAKPKSCRNSSVESFVVCRQFTLPEGFQRGVLRQIDLGACSEPAHDDHATESLCLVPFVACGDLSGYDADANYDLPEGEEGGRYEPIEPTQKPTTPAYRAYLEQQQATAGRRTVLDAEWREERTQSGAAAAGGAGEDSMDVT